MWRIPGILEAQGEEGRGGAQLTVSPFPSCMDWACWGYSPLCTAPGANPWPWNDSVERDISHARDPLGEQFWEHLLQLSSKTFISPADH